MENRFVREEEERVKPDLLRRGFEFFRYRDLPPHFRAADVHIHDAIELVYLVEGSVVVNLDDREERLMPGDLVMFRSRGIHTMRTEGCPVNRYYTLKIRPKLIHKLSPKNLAARIGFRFSVYNSDLKFVFRKEELEGGEILSGIKSLIADYHGDDELSDLTMLSSVITVIHGILKCSEADKAALTPAIDQIYDSIVYINESFAEDVTAVGMAERVNMCYSYFAREFKRATGKTFKEYLNITRINEAEQLLLSTDLPVTEVALRCGYNNVSYFISLYKKYKGKTPLAERR